MAASATLRRAVMALVAAAVVGAILVGWVGLFLVSPQGHESRGESRRMVVPQGSSASDVGELLEDAGIVRPAWLFSGVLRVSGLHRELKAGEYEIELPVSPRQVMRILHEGRLVTVPITVPEGLTLEETAETLAASGVATYDEIVAAFREPGAVADLDADALDLEGYLFPETYRFAKGTPADRIAASMVEEFRARFHVPLAREIARSELSLREIVALASLVEKETSLDDERPLIAGVFAERLARGMRLQCDPTVIYAMKREGIWRGNIRRRDLTWDHPYNTYVRRGLPPGPIASPGLASLQSSLEPERSGAIFFVATGNPDGSHAFSETLAEHNRNVSEYLRRTRR